MILILFRNLQYLASLTSSISRARSHLFSHVSLSMRGLPRRLVCIHLMRPLLSHDSKHIISKITDRNKRSGHATKTVCLIGYPTVIFCSAGAYLESQELTRSFVLSPQTTKEKLDLCLRLLHEKLRNPIEFEKTIKEDPERAFLIRRIRGIKSANIAHILITEEDMIQIHENFSEDHPFLSPRLMRDLPRLYALIKAHSLMNLYKRERFETDSERFLMANHQDVVEGYRLYKYIAESNELGLTPETYEIWIQMHACARMRMRCN